MLYYGLRDGTFKGLLEERRDYGKAVVCFADSGWCGNAVVWWLKYCIPASIKLGKWMAGWKRKWEKYKKYDKEYYFEIIENREKNKEKLKIKRKEYREKNKEKIKR